MRPIGKHLLNGNRVVYPATFRYLSRMASLRTYSIGLVGERSYQPQIVAIGEGEAVVLYSEPDNPHDDRAIAASCHGDTIGYVPRDSWLTDALIDEGQGCIAKVSRLTRGPKGLMGVTLEVRLEGDPIDERAFAPA